MSPAEQSLAYEKILYRYSSALERGDFELVAAILAQAETDTELERLLLELDRAYTGKPTTQAEILNTAAKKPGEPGGFARWLKRPRLELEHSLDQIRQPNWPPISPA